KGLARDLATHVFISGVAKDADDLHVRRRLPPPPHQAAHGIRAVQVLFDQSLIDQAAVLDTAPVGPGDVTAGFDRNPQCVEVSGRNGVLKAPRVVSGLWLNSRYGNLAIGPPA